MRWPSPSLCKISVFEGPTDTMRRGRSSGCCKFVTHPSRRTACYCARTVSEQRVLIDLDVAAPMRDGVNLRANIYRPAEGRWPVLLTRLPYGKDTPLGSASLD